MTGAEGSTVSHTPRVLGSDSLLELFCAALGLNKPRGWTLALNDEVAKVKACAAEGEVEGMGRGWRMKCSRWYLQLPQKTANEVFDSK